MGHDFFRNDDERPEHLKQESTEKYIEREEKIDFFSQPKEEKKEVKAEVEVEKEEKEEVKSVEDKIEEKEEEIDQMVADGASKKEIKQAVKELAALYDGKEIKVPVAAKFKHKVDGQDVEVQLEELLNNYSGKQSWDKRFSELDKERSSYKKDLDVVNRYVNEFAEESKKDKLSGLLKLAEAVGIDPLEYKKQLRNDFISKFQDYMSMNEAQREFFELKEQNEYLLQRQQLKEQKEKEAQAQRERESQMSTVRKSLNIDDARFDYIAKELTEGFNMEVNPANVQEMHYALSRLDRVDAALTKVNPSLVDDSKVVTQLESFLRSNPDMTDEQLAETAAKLWGTEVKQAVTNAEKRAPKREVQTPKKALKYQSKLNTVGNKIDFFDL